MSFLPITAEELRTCAERWGWDTSPTYRGIWSFTKCFCMEKSDEHNAAAILDRISHLVRKGGPVSIYSDCVTCSWWEKGQARRVDVPAPTDEAPNLLSWLLVELTKQLPPEVWQ